MGDSTQLLGKIIINVYMRLAQVLLFIAGTMGVDDHAMLNGYVVLQGRLLHLLT